MKYVTLNREQLTKLNDLMRMRAGNKVLQTALLDNNDLLYFIAEYQENYGTIRLYWTNANRLENKDAVDR